MIVGSPCEDSEIKDLIESGSTLLLEHAYKGYGIKLDSDPTIKVSTGPGPYDTKIWSYSDALSSSYTEDIVIAIKDVLRERDC